jgi:hypothetical protein
MLFSLGQIVLHLAPPNNSIDPVILLYYVPLAVMLILGFIAFASLFAFGGVGRNSSAQLAAALFLLLVGEAFFVVLQVWPGAKSDNTFLDISLPGMWYLFIAGLLFIGGLTGAGGINVFISIAIFLLSLGAAIWPGHTISSTDYPFITEYTYGGVLFLLSLLALIISQRGNFWATIKQPLLLGGIGALLTIALLVVRGADNWRNIPYGADILLISWVVGIAIFVIGRRAAQANIADQA